MLIGRLKTGWFSLKNISRPQRWNVKNKEMKLVLEPMEPCSFSSVAPPVDQRCPSLTDMFVPAGLQLGPWQERGDHLQCSKLLLPLWKPGGHHGTGRHSEIFFVSTKNAFTSYERPNGAEVKYEYIHVKHTEPCGDPEGWTLNITNPQIPFNVSLLSYNKFSMNTQTVLLRNESETSEHTFSYIQGHTDSCQQGATPEGWHELSSVNSPDEFLVWIKCSYSGSFGPVTVETSIKGEGLGAGLHCDRQAAPRLAPYHLILKRQVKALHHSDHLLCTVWV